MKERNCFSVITADFVTDDTGTGIVHMAPGFGDDDYQACIAHKLIEPGRAPVPVDFDNDYKTMDKDFMESVWWTFKQIFDKGLVYRGSKIMPFSTACNTVLSNFEAGSNFKEVSDPAIIVSFPLIDDPETSFIAWTTTPWTLPSNLAVAVNPNFTYVKIHD